MTYRAKNGSEVVVVATGGGEDMSPDGVRAGSVIEQRCAELKAARYTAQEDS